MPQGVPLMFADVSHADISMFPAPSHVQTAGQATAPHRHSLGPGSYTALPQCHLNGHSALLTRSYLSWPQPRSWDAPTTSEDATSLLARLPPPPCPLSSTGATSSRWRGFPTHLLAPHGSLLPEHKSSRTPAMARCTLGPPLSPHMGTGHQPLPPLAGPFL